MSNVNFLLTTVEKVPRRHSENPQRGQKTIEDATPSTYGQAKFSEQASTVELRASKTGCAEGYALHITHITLLPPILIANASTSTTSKTLFYLPPVSMPLSPLILSPKTRFATT